MCPPGFMVFREFCVVAGEKKSFSDKDSACAPEQGKPMVVDDAIGHFMVDAGLAGAAAEVG